MISVYAVHYGQSGDRTEKLLKEHKTDDIRRIARLYAKRYDCRITKGLYQYVLIPNISNPGLLEGNWRIWVRFGI